MSSTAQDENGISAGELTRARLREAAKKLFSEHGFAGTNVREITKLADCNVAAVNYHFRSKDGLYEEMWRGLLEERRDELLESIARAMSDSEPSLRGLLTEYSQAFLGTFIRNEGESPVAKLMSWEMMEHHLPKAMLTTELMRPIEARLMEALGALVPGLDEPTARFCCASLVGQLIHTAIMFRGGGGCVNDYVEFNALECAEFIVRFTEAGILGISGGENQ